MYGLCVTMACESGNGGDTDGSGGSGGCTPRDPQRVHACDQGTGGMSSSGSTSGTGGIVDEWHGIMQWGSAEDDEGIGIAVSDDGYVHIVGNTWGEWSDLPGAVGDADIFTTKLSPAGDVEWARRMGSASADEAASVALSADGFTYVAASVRGLVDNQSYSGDRDTLIARYAPDGLRNWLIASGSPSVDAAKAIALDERGNPLMVGYTLANAAKDGEIFMNSHDANTGAAVPEILFGSTAFDAGMAMTYDPHGNLFICGHSTGNLGATSAGSYDLILIKFDAQGVQQWIRQLGTEDIDGSFAISTDVEGNIYVGAVSYSDLASGQFEDDLLKDTFLLKFDAVGQLVWSRRPSSNKNRETMVAAVAASNDGVYVTGWTQADLDGQGQRGGRDAFVLKYDFDGNLMWTRQFGGPADDEGHGLDVDPMNVLYVVGAAGAGFEGLPGAGGKDVFVMKLDASGQLL